MAGLNDTPSGNRTHIAFFGRRNAGKSTLVNALTGQEIAIVSDVAGTTTDPVSKAMEILPLGPCVITDTAGLDDEGALGAERVRRTLEVLEKTDVAVWVATGAAVDDAEADFLKTCAARNVPVLRYQRGEDVAELKRRIAAVRLEDAPRPLVGDLVRRGDTVVCVCPIDESAPRGRLILPQQQVVRELLDAGAAALVCQPDTLAQYVAAENPRCPPPRFVITDSQAFGAVSRIVPPEVPLTSFSIVFARAKGDLAVYCAGVAAMRGLADGDAVLIAEGCTHHRQCGDIGTVKLPRWIEEYTGRKLAFEFCSGAAFPEDVSKYALVIQCGGCMLTRRAVQARIARCRAAGVPIANYGLVIAACHGIHVEPESCMVRR
ncbi:MAG: GTP-binding protein [Kiritimatiellia bacterium]